MNKENPNIKFVLYFLGIYNSFHPTCFCESYTGYQCFLCKKIIKSYDNGVMDYCLKNELLQVAGRGYKITELGRKFIKLYGEIGETAF